jgi:hypothetical protein
MNVYERILNILLEARVDMFIQDRLDDRSPQARANKAKKQALKRDSGHRVDKLLKGRFSDGGISADALKKAGEARKSGNKPEAQRQVGRSQKMDKPQLP